MKRYLLLLLLLFFLSSNTVSGYSISGSYKNIDGETTNFDSYEGELLVVEAFSTTCEHCHDYYPKLNSTYSEFNSSIQMLSLSISDEDTLQSLKSYNSSYPTTWDMGLDNQEDGFQSSYGIFATPTTLFFDSNGEVKECMVGNIEKSQLTSNLHQFISDPAGYTGNLENGQCPQPSFFQRFISSIWFPIVGVLVLYALYYGIKKYRNR